MEVIVPLHPRFLNILYERIHMHRNEGYELKRASIDLSAGHIILDFRPNARHISQRKMSEFLEGDQ